MAADLMSAMPGAYVIMFGPALAPVDVVFTVTTELLTLHGAPPARPTFALRPSQLDPCFEPGTKASLKVMMQVEPRAG